MLEPLLVRPIEQERFEIVAGSRRYRAARIAELHTVPPCVGEISDAEALEVQCLENLQRQDIRKLSLSRHLLYLRRRTRLGWSDCIRKAAGSTPLNRRASAGQTVWGKAAASGQMVDKRKQIREYRVKELTRRLRELLKGVRFADQNPISE